MCVRDSYVYQISGLCFFIRDSYVSLLVSIVLSPIMLLFQYSLKLSFSSTLAGLYIYEGWNFNSGNYLFTTDTKYIHVSKFYCPSV